jgi:xanthine dehydrogenase accessory factor
MSTRVASHNAGREPRGRWLRALRDNWPVAVCRLLEGREPAVVRVLIAQVRGSAPREPGACMLVSHSGVDGTIGGGNLEWQAIQTAQSLLVAGTAPAVRLRRLVLGRELGQCCGGVVQLWLERFTPADLPRLRRVVRAGCERTSAALVTELSAHGVVRTLQALEPGVQPRLQFSASSDENAILLEPLASDAAALWLYGAGHVGQALIRILAELPFEVTWIDPRAELLPEPLPDNVHPLCSQTPTHTVHLAPAGARFLVMTHDHALDYALCRRILERSEFAWLGLIGSKSKGARFRSRLARDGAAPEAIARLVCPIGVGAVASKWPASIAVGVAAQLLQGLETSVGVRPLNLASSSATVACAGGCPSPECAACSSPFP